MQVYICFQAIFFLSNFLLKFGKNLGKFHHDLPATLLLTSLEISGMRYDLNF